MLNCSFPLNWINLHSTHLVHHLGAAAGSLMTHLWPDLPLSYLWGAAFYENLTSLNHLLKILHLPWASIRALTHRGSGGPFTPVCTGSQSPGPNSFLHFYGWIHYWKVIFPGALETMERVKWYHGGPLYSAWGVLKHPKAANSEKCSAASFHQSFSWLTCLSASHTSTALMSYRDPDVMCSTKGGRKTKLSTNCQNSLYITVYTINTFGYIRKLWATFQIKE